MLPGRLGSVCGRRPAAAASGGRGRGWKPQVAGLSTGQRGRGRGSATARAARVGGEQTLSC